MPFHGLRLGVPGSVGALLRILLSSSTVADNAAVGTVIGTLSTVGGTGSYTYTLITNPGGQFSITTNQLKVAAALTAGSYSVSIKADNGAGSTVTMVFLITVTSTALALKADFSATATTEAWAFW